MTLRKSGIYHYRPHDENNSESIVPTGTRSSFSGAILGGEKYSPNDNKLRKHSGDIYRFGAGVKYDDANSTMSQQNQWIPVRPFSHRIATMGGNIASAITSPQSTRYGFLEPYLEGVSFTDGLGKYHTPETIENSDLYRELIQIRSQLIALCQANPAIDRMLRKIERVFETHSASIFMHY
jgi:FAD/FMN-containing dehydrogenase